MKKPKDSLKISYEVAKKIMKERATSFYQAFQLLPAERFLGICAVYAFCRYADDIGDGNLSKEEKTKFLEELEQNLRKLYKEEAKSDFREEWWEAFADTVRKYKIPPQGFLSQIEGQRRDIGLEQIPNMQEFLEYCRLVAGSVGVMLAPLLAGEKSNPSDPDFILSCEKLGIGMQITNILRDVGEDYKERHRIYLPQDKLMEYGIDRNFFETYIVKGNSGQELPESFLRLWEELAELADDFYDAYKEKLRYFLPEARFPLVAAALCYREIAEAVRRENHDCLTQRCYTSAFTRMQLIAKAKKIAENCQEMV